MRNLHSVPFDVLVALKARNCSLQDGRYDVEKSRPGPLIRIEFFGGVCGVVIAGDSQNRFTVIVIEPDGTLVVASNGRAWRSLVDALEANVDAVAELVSTGWDGR